MDESKDISVILAIRNEEKYIRKCLESLINQKYPQERFEILVIDGKSNDCTIEILIEFQKRMPNLIRILDNPGITSPIGRNIGIKNSRGKYIMILSGHSYVDSQCLIKLVKSLESHPHSVAGIGSAFESAEDESTFGKITADVQSTLLGGFGSTFRKMQNEKYVETATFTLYRKEVLESVGLHDEEFEVAQDLEMNLRIKKAGFKLILNPTARVYYYRRHSNFQGLFKRMLKYGIGKGHFVRKHPRSFKGSFCIPTLILILILSLPFVSFGPQIVIYTNFILLGGYITAIMLSTFSLCVYRKSIKHMIAAPIYIIEHIAFGVGFLIGLISANPASLPSNFRQLKTIHM